MNFEKIKTLLESNFREKETLGKLVSNFFWLAFDKFFRMGVGLFVSVLIIRHLGSEEFGKWNYVIAFYSFFSVFIALGLDTIVIRELVVRKEIKDKILGSVLLLRFAGALTAFFLSLGVLYVWTGGERELLKIMFVISSSSFFLIFDTIDLQYRSELKSKVSVLTKNVSFALISVLRIYLLYAKAELMYFVLANAAELVLGALFLIAVHGKSGASILAWRADWVMMKKFLRESWTWALALFVTTIFMKTDQVFIGDLLDKHSLGLYSASLKLYDIAYSFVSMAFFSVFPKIAALHERDAALFRQKSGQLIFYFTLFAVFAALFMFFFGDILCAMLYGTTYKGVEEVVVFHFVALIFVFNGFLRSGFLTVSKKNSDLLFINLSTAILILPLDYLAIKHFGLRGAAIMTIVLQAYAFYFSNFFFASTRELFYMQSRAFLKVFDYKVYSNVLKKIARY